jgi:hypothetical protein
VNLLRLRCPLVCATQGAGLRNLGNTCYLNSVLQCLTYTEPFVAYLQSGKHKSSCKSRAACKLAYQFPAWHLVVMLETLLLSWGMMHFPVKCLLCNVIGGGGLQAIGRAFRCALLDRPLPLLHWRNLFHEG